MSASHPSQALWNDQPEGLRDVAIAWAAAESASRRAVADALLRDLVTKVHPGDFEVARQCPECGSSAHGQPRIVPAAVTGRPDESSRRTGCPRVSVAYTHGLAFVAVAGSDALAIGIDLEPDDQATRLRVREALTGAEASSRLSRTPGVRDWTRLEAVTKAIGSGLRCDLAAIRFSPRDGEPGIDAAWIATAPASRDAACSVRFEGFDVTLDPGAGTGTGQRSVIVSVALRRNPTERAAAAADRTASRPTPA